MDQWPDEWPSEWTNGPNGVSGRAPPHVGRLLRLVPPLILRVHPHPHRLLRVCACACVLCACACELCCATEREKEGWVLREILFCRSQRFGLESTQAGGERKKKGKKQSRCVLGCEPKKNKKTKSLLSSDGCEKVKGGWRRVLVASPAANRINKGSSALDKVTHSVPLADTSVVGTSSRATRA